MKRILILFSIMLLAGCVSGFDVKKANTYLLSHPDRPDHIKEAVSIGEVVMGMNEEEVTICMGKPDIITTTQSYPLNKTSNVWTYLNPAKFTRKFIVFRDGVVEGVNVTTQTGTVGVPYSGGVIYPGPVTRPYPGGTFIPGPVRTPAHPHVVVQPRPVIVNSPVKKRCSK